MIKNILSLEDVNTLDKNEQKNINGGEPFGLGGSRCFQYSDCYTPYINQGTIFCSYNGYCQYY